MTIHLNTSLSRKNRTRVARSGDPRGDRTLTTTASRSFCLAIAEGSHQPTRAAAKEGGSRALPILSCRQRPNWQGVLTGLSWALRAGGLRFDGRISLYQASVGDGLMHLSRQASAGSSGLTSVAITTGHQVGP
jgi:hypothetical protein